MCCDLSLLQCDLYAIYDCVCACVCVCMPVCVFWAEVDVIKKEQGKDRTACSKIGTFRVSHNDFSK